MKKQFLTKCQNLIMKYNPNYTDIKMEEIMYGLEGLYLTITKIIVLVSLALILGILPEMIILMLIYNSLRITAFGIHATKSIYCMISSTVIFIGGVYVVKYLAISYTAQILIGAILTICLYLYAPADTVKHPIINVKKRKRFKLITSITGTIYLLLIIFLKNNLFTNYILVGMTTVVLCINPLTYKIFKLPYNNYKYYNIK